MNPDTAPAKEVIILAAARRRFAHFGFSKVTMDEIASDVGMAKPSLYYYYATKEQLFNAVISQEQQQFAADIEALLKRRVPAGQKLRDYVGIRLRLFRELVNLSHIGFDSWTEMKAVSREPFRNLEQQELKYIQTIVAEGRATGEFAIPHPHQTAQIFLHVLQGLRLRMLRSPGSLVFDDAAYTELRKESDTVIDWLIHGIRTQTQRQEHV